MEKLLLMLIFFHVSSSEEHFLKIFSVGFYGNPNPPGFIGTVEVDGIEAAYCDSNEKMKLKQSWVETLTQTDPAHLNWYKGQCFENQPYNFKEMLKSLMQSFSQSEGVHVLQRISGCVWGDETGEVKGFIKYGYDGEDILFFDVKRKTWIALKQQAVTLTQRWDADEARLKYDERYLTEIFPKWLQKYVEVGKTSLLRTVLPSVSLLQKSPSSPITCHATGFYPNRAVLFWRKDGEELFEDVENGEILPNHDGSFQMSVELLKLPPEDWGKYECVFLLSGVKEDMVTKLHKNIIRTNDEALSLGMTIIIIVISIFIMICLCTASCCFLSSANRIHRKATRTRNETLNLKQELTMWKLEKPGQRGNTDFKY